MVDLKHRYKFIIQAKCIKSSLVAVNGFASKAEVKDSIGGIGSAKE